MKAIDYGEATLRRRSYTSYDKKSKQEINVDLLRDNGSIICLLRPCKLGD